MNLANEINKLIMSSAVEGTFNPDAVKRFSGMIERVEALEISLDDEKKLTETLMKEKVILKEKLSDAETKLIGVETREADIKAKEIEFIKLELKAEHEAKRVSDHQTMFSQVFRNTEVRRSMSGSKPYGDSGCTAYVNEDVTERAE